MKELFKTDDGRFLDLSDVVEFPPLLSTTKEMEDCHEYIDDLPGMNGWYVRMLKTSGYSMNVSLADYKKIYKMIDGLQGAVKSV